MKSQHETIMHSRWLGMIPNVVGKSSRFQCAVFSSIFNRALKKRSCRCKFSTSQFVTAVYIKCSFFLHSGAVVSVQHNGPGFEFWLEFFLHGCVYVCVFSSFPSLVKNIICLQMINKCECLCAWLFIFCLCTGAC